MKKWNTRPWSTPVTIGAGIFVATTGLTMFFVPEEPSKFAHELGGIAFSAAILLHVPEPTGGPSRTTFVNAALSASS